MNPNFDGEEGDAVSFKYMINKKVCFSPIFKIGEFEMYALNYVILRWRYWRRGS